jgi:phosphatidylglycerol:prolipoprotein diacylglycerol transferase
MRPVLFTLGSLPIRSYGLMIALAFLAGIWLARRRFRTRGLDPDIVIDLAVLVILTSIAGARAAYVFVRWDYFAGDPAAVFRIWEGGLALYGGVVVGVVVGLGFLARRGVDIWKGADLVAPSLALGIAIGRIGCFLNGCCFGRPCDLPWAVSFGPDSVAGHEYAGLLLHPTQIYESLIALAIVLVLLAAERRKPFDGFLFWLFVALLALSRFFIDPLRQYGTESILLRKGALELTNNQAMGVALIVVSFAFMLRLSRRGLAIESPAGPPRSRSPRRSEPPVAPREE